MNINKNNFTEIEARLKEEATSRLNYSENQIYSKFKSKITIKLASIFVFLSLKFEIKPNTITFIYIAAVFFAFLLISFGTNKFVLLGLIIYFFKNSLDNTDGHLARITNNTTQLGHILDIWAGFFSLILFQISIYFYTFSNTDNKFYIFAAIFILLLYCIDFKKHYLSLKSENSNESKSFTLRKDKISENFSPIFKTPIKILSLIDYDGRSRYTDLVILIILIEILFNQLFLSHIFCTIWFITCVGKFSLKFYLTIQNLKNEKK